MIQINGKFLISSLLSLQLLSTVKIISAIDFPEEFKSEIDRLHLLARIVNGSQAAVAQFPHQVSLRYSWNGVHFCGGSIIDERWILTAAHCMFLQTGAQIQPWMVIVVAGDLWLNQTSVNSQNRITTQIIVHENYDHVTYQNDVALLKLSKPLTFERSSVKYQVLQNRTLPAGTMCQVAGWGYPAEDILLLVNELMYVDLPIVSHKLCQEFYSKFADITEGMICAGYAEGMRDACQGDSGGGLICDGILTGIVSSGNGCASPGYPGIYTNVKYYRDWIFQSSGIEDKSNGGDSVMRFSPWTVSTSIIIIGLLRKLEEYRYLS